ncbi:MAG: hypothetical protein U1E97_03815 [Alphaproteobacteria bacterium]
MLSNLKRAVVAASVAAAFALPVAGVTSLGALAADKPAHATAKDCTKLKNDGKAYEACMKNAAKAAPATAPAKK